MRFFCSKDCPDFCVFDIQKAIGGDISINPRGKSYLKRDFVCSKLRDFYALDVLAKDKSFYVSSGSRVYRDVIGNLGEFLKSNRDKRILFYRGSGSLGYYMEFWDLFFSNFENCYFVDGSPCDESGIRAHIEDFGCCVNPDIRNLEMVDAIILFGKNAKVTSPHLYAYLLYLAGKGKKIVCIDPVESETCSIATRFVRIKPGADGVLSCALLSGLGMYDYDADELLRISGVSGEDFEYLLGMFSSGRCGIIEGYSLQRYSNGKNSVQWINRLGYYTGNIEFLYYGRPSKGCFVRPAVFRKNTVPISELVSFLESGFFDVIVVVASNPVVTFPRADVWKDTLEKTPTIVVGTHIDETASCADYFVKVGGMFAQEDVGGSYFFNEERERERFDNRLYSDTDVIKKLASCVGVDVDIPRAGYVERKECGAERRFSERGIDLLFPSRPPSGKFRLITRSHVGYLNSQRKCGVRDVVFISGEDATKLMVSPGDVVRIFNDVGSFITTLEVRDLVPSGCLVMFKSLNSRVNSVTPPLSTDIPNALALYEVFVGLAKES